MGEQGPVAELVMRCSEQCLRDPTRFQRSRALLVNVTVLNGWDDTPTLSDAQPANTLRGVAVSYCLLMLVCWHTGLRAGSFPFTNFNVGEISVVSYCM